MKSVILHLTHNEIDLLSALIFLLIDGSISSERPIDFLMVNSLSVKLDDVHKIIVQLEKTEHA